MTSVCRPWWYNVTSGSGYCPYGTRLPGDVTLPNDPAFLEWVAVAYSYLPWVIVALVLFEFLLERRGTRELSVLLFTGITTLINEFIVKNIMHQARPGAYGPAPGAMRDQHGHPFGSCNHSCGMPSSHSTMASGFLFLTIFDGIMRVAPSMESLSGLDDPNGSKRIRKMLSCTPLSPRPVLSHYECIGFFCIWMLFMAPVPIMRVRLGDHSATQVISGCLLGACYAFAWFQFTMHLVHKNKDKLGIPVFYGMLTHNYAPLAFRVKIAVLEQDECLSRTLTSRDWEDAEWKVLDEKLVVRDHVYMHLATETTRLPPSPSTDRPRAGSLIVKIDTASEQEVRTAEVRSDGSSGEESE